MLPVALPFAGAGVATRGQVYVIGGGMRGAGGKGDKPDNLINNAHGLPEYKNSHTDKNARMCRHDCTQYVLLRLHAGCDVLTQLRHGCCCVLLRCAVLCCVMQPCAATTWPAWTLPVRSGAAVRHPACHACTQESPAQQVRVCLCLCCRGSGCVCRHWHLAQGHHVSSSHEDMACCIS
jgi:hypothetical protein